MLVMFIVQLFVFGLTSIAAEYLSENTHHKKNHEFVSQQQQATHSMHLSSQTERQSNIIRDRTRVQDKEHIKEHLEGVIEEPDLGQMSEEELQFHYFKLHDNDGNNMLDGCELVKSLIHWHLEELKQTPSKSSGMAGKVFSDAELSTMIDPILDMDDRNQDGYIDYPEFVSAQESRGIP